MGLSEAFYEITKEGLKICNLSFCFFSIIFIILIYKQNVLIFDFKVFLIILITLFLLFLLYRIYSFICLKIWHKLINKVHNKTIEAVERLSDKGFDRYFTICKLCYYLGSYKESTFYAQLALSSNDYNSAEHQALVYHYLARIAYKTKNHSMAIVFYDETIKDLLNIEQNSKVIEGKIGLIERFKKNILKENKKEESSEDSIHSLPNLYDMITYSQQNRTKIENTNKWRIYCPLILALIVSIISSLFQIYSQLYPSESKAIITNCEECVINKEKQKTQIDKVNKSIIKKTMKLNDD